MAKTPWYQSHEAACLDPHYYVLAEVMLCGLGKLAGLLSNTTPQGIAASIRSSR